MITRRFNRGSDMEHSMKRVLWIGAALTAISLGVISPVAAQPYYGYGGYHDGWRGRDRGWDYRDRWEHQRRWDERRLGKSGIAGTTAITVAAQIYISVSS